MVSFWFKENLTHLDHHYSKMILRCSHATAWLQLFIFIISTEGKWIQYYVFSITGHTVARYKKVLWITYGRFLYTDPLSRRVIIPTDFFCAMHVLCSIFGMPMYSHHCICSVCLLRNMGKCGMAYNWINQFLCLGWFGQYFELPPSTCE